MSLRRIFAALMAAAVMTVSMGFTDPAAAQQLTPEQRKAQAQAKAAQGKAAPAPQAQRAPARPAPQQQARRSGGGNTGRNVAIGVGAAVIGGVLLSEAARAERRRRGVVVVEEEYDDMDDRRQRCADRYRSFDWDDGTYVNRDGDRVLCPYLR